MAPTSNLATGYRRVPEPGNTGHKTSRDLKLPPGVYYWSVQTVDNGFSGSGFTPERATTEDIDTRWHMLRSPTTAPTGIARRSSRRQHRTPSPISRQIHVARDLLRNGEGYWLKFNAVDNPTIFGAGPGLNAITVPVTAGWNLIGTISTVVVPRM